MIARTSFSIPAAPSIRRESVSTPRPHATRYFPGLVAAVGIHAGLLFAWQRPAIGPTETAEFAVEFAESSVEVSLIAALPADEVVEVIDEVTEPEPEVIPPPPVPEPVPEPLPVAEIQPEMAIPAPEAMPEPPPPVPREMPKPQPMKAPSKPKPVRATRAVGDGSSAIPGNDATTAAASTGAASAKPGYLRNPHPAYPEEARKLGQHGVVSLRIGVDASGRPTSVELTRSSGFPLLDERARSTVAGRWAFKPARFNGQAVPSQIVVPIRFTLGR